MKAKELIKKYNNLYIVKKDNTGHFLKDIYPIPILIEGQDEAIWIDQGNFGGCACTIKVINNKLYVEDNGNWTEEDIVEFK